MRLYGVMLVALAFSGCAQRQAEQNIIAACKIPDGRIDGSCAVKHPDFNKLSQTDQRAASYAHMTNEQVKAGKLTQAQSDFLNREYAAKLTNEQAAIDNANSQATSSALMATGASLMALDAANRQPAVSYPAPQQNFPRTTTCMGGYRSVTCTNF